MVSLAITHGLVIYDIVKSIHDSIVHPHFGRLPCWLPISSRSYAFALLAVNSRSAITSPVKPHLVVHLAHRTVTLGLLSHPAHITTFRHFPHVTGIPITPHVAVNSSLKFGKGFLWFSHKRLSTLRVSTGFGRHDLGSLA